MLKDESASERRLKGYTLLEVIIALAILSIVAAIGLPAYGNYVKRSKMADVLTIANDARVALIADHVKRRRFVQNYNDISRRNQEIGLAPTSFYENDTVLAMWVGSGGVKGADDTSAHIAIMIDPSLGLNDGGYSRLLSTIEYRDGEYEYICGNTNAVWVSTIKHEYLPEFCRN